MLQLCCHRRVRQTVLLMLVSQVLTVTHAASRQREPVKGIVVEEVPRHSEGEKAGIRSGDLLVSWTRTASPPTSSQSARGTLASPFDFVDLELEQRPRGTVTVTGFRDGREFTATMLSTESGLTVRPCLTGDLLRLYEEGKTRADANDIDGAAERWLTAATQARAAADWSLAVWFALRAASLVSRRDTNLAGYAPAADIAAASKSPALLAAVLESKGRAAYANNDRPRARAAFEEALRIWEGLPGRALRVARTLRSLGTITYDAQAPDTAEAFWRRALAIAEKEAPDGLEVAAILSYLAEIEWIRSKLPEAEATSSRSVALLERHAPRSTLFANTLHLMGMVAHDRGDLTAAEQLNRRALEIRQDVGPDTLDVAWSFHNLADIAFHRGELALADEFHAHALRIREKLAPQSRDFAATLSSRALLAINRGQFEAADHLLTRSLAINEKLNTQSREVALTLNSLGMVRTARGDLDAAEQLYQRALAIREKLAPNSFDVAMTLNHLGIVLRRRGELERAEQTSRRSLDIYGQLGARGLGFALTLQTLADIAYDRGDLKAAERRYDEAITIFRQVAPGSTPEAEALHGLATVSRKAGQRDRAAAVFRQALDALESQTYKIGMSEEIRTGFAASYADYYRDYIDVLLDLQQPAQAFHVLERSRARSLLRMLAERPLVPRELGSDLTERRKQLDTDYDRTQARLAVLSPGKDQPEIDQQLARLRDLVAQREALAERIRRESPRFARLQYPDPLDVDRARAALDKGTVLLAYSVGKEKTFLFVVQPATPLMVDAPAVSVITIPVGDAALRDRVNGFRDQIQRRALSNTPSAAAPLADAQRLFSLLIAPASAFVAAADRVLISPDGPLHSLPFAALVEPQREEDRSATPRYLVELKPLHTAVSATVYAELKKGRRARSPQATTLAAFGDPEYGGRGTAAGKQPATPLANTIGRRASGLPPLPASRTEVNEIARLYGRRASRYLGADATETRVKALGKHVGHVHFATHGIIDEQWPLNSGIALTPPGTSSDPRDNGVLQAWEIIDHLRLDADLVTLSACETALGAEAGGEGLVGLTRAFHYAGARSVLASLWSVADDSTAELMTNFYRYVRMGRSKDAALRAAQLDLVRSRHFSHPFHWAAFTLSGDWR